MPTSVDRYAQVPEQLAWPVTQPSAQVPEVQTFPAPHAWPQEPQLTDELWRLVSQPLLATPSQSSKPALQLESKHAPDEQPAVAFDRLQALPHAPQLAAVT